MGSVRLAWPDWTQATVSVTPTLSGGSYDATLTLQNVKDRQLSLVARSSDTQLSSTRAHFDLGADREVGAYVIPKWTRSISGSYVRFLSWPSSMLFVYEAGDDITALGGTFARADAATCATYIDRNGVVRTVAANILRDAHFIGGVRHTLLEPTSANLCLRSADFGTTWAAVGSPTRSAAAHTASGVTLDLIGDDDGAALEGYTQTITFTADAAKAISVFVKQGSSTSSVIRIRDTSAGADRLLAAITWSGTTPVITMTTGTSLGSIACGDGVYRILLVATTVTAANTNSLQIYPATNAALATASTGTIYAGGVQAENLTFPTSYIATTSASVTRAADVLTFPWTHLPQAMTTYVKFVERESPAFVASGGFSSRLIHIGHVTAISTDARFYLFKSQTTDNYGANHDPATETGSSRDINPAFGSVVELRGVLASTGAVTLGATLDGGAESVSSASTAQALAADWAGDVLHVGGVGAATGNSTTAFRSIRIMAGEQTLATMQALVYDSGWLDGWPSTMTLEEADGINVPTVHLPSTSHTARYGCVQIDDYSNSAGYVDIARLMVAKCYEPTINASVNAHVGLETSTVRTETDGGSAVYDVKPVRRRMRFALEHIEENEAWLTVWRIKRQAGTSGQIFAIYSDDDGDELMAERSFLCTIRELGMLEEPNVDRRFATVFELVEEI